jgi:cell division protein FtsN
LQGAALAAIGTVAVLALTHVRPDARSESRDGIVMASPGGVPLIKAEPGPSKIKPKDPGGLIIPHKDKSIYQQLEGQRKFVPAADPGKGPKKPAPKTGQKKMAQDLGPYRVQLGSFENAESAQRRWQELRSRHADLVGGLQMVLERVELKAKGTMFRLQAGPFRSPDDVQKLCSALAKRNVGCFLVKS